MATKKKGLHASKRRSNSSPELELQVIDTDTKTDHLSAHIVAGNGREANAGVEQCKLTSNHGDSSKDAQTLESQSSDSSSPIVLNQCQVKCASCGSIRGERKTLGPSVRSKVKTSHLKTKKLPKNRQKNVVSTDRVMMDVDNHSESATTSGSDTEDAAELSSKQFKKQGIGRVASAFVAKFRPKAHRHRRRSSNTDSDSSSSAKEVPEETFRPRSKSFSGRIMRKFGTKEKAMNGKDSPRRDLTWRKARSHTSRIQSCIGVVFTGKGTTKKGKPSKTEQETNRPRRYTPVINLEEFNPDDYPIESEDDIQRVLREQEIRDGVDPPPGFQPHFLAKAESHSEPTAKVLNAKKTCQEARRVEAASSGAGPYASNSATYPTVHAPSHTTANIYDQYGSLTPEGNYIPRTVHTQIDYMHCLVPDQENIMNSSFYWGKIDRFEADLLLENKPEGTFLLRDSAHDEFVFSVSFRRYGRTLHARIEQWKHKFSFDAHDPGVYSDDTISGLLKHYKDPNFCMFFEPMLTIPLPRPNPPSLQELARATICSHTTYDGIAHLALPRTLKEFAREYHYKQRVRMRRFEVPEMPIVPEPTMGVITKTCISR